LYFSTHKEPAARDDSKDYAASVVVTGEIMARWTLRNFDWSRMPATGISTWLIATLMCIGPARGAETQNTFHQNFDAVLKEHVSAGRVDYPAIARDARFAEYLAALKAPQRFVSREEELAYWINAYNALAIKGILDGRSPGSFTGRIGFFKSAKYKVGGMTIDLYNLEHDVIIPLGEPRVHFSINCASASCPVLDSRAYSSASLDQQLEQNARAFINDTTRNRFDRAARIAWLSKIFDWFERDFTKAAGSVPQYIARYVADPELARELSGGEYKIRYLEYDWRLNGTPPGDR
jgi:hypothetical protein